MFPRCVLCFIPVFECALLWELQGDMESNPSPTDAKQESLLDFVDSERNIARGRAIEALLPRPVG